MKGSNVKLPTKAESDVFMRTLAIRNSDLLLPMPVYKNGLLTDKVFVVEGGRFVEKQAGCCGVAYEWLHEGWGLTDEPSPEQIAAALFMEARDQDGCVERGESAASYPVRLRELAYQIIDYHHKTHWGPSYP